MKSKIVSKKVKNAINIRGILVQRNLARGRALGVFSVELKEKARPVGGLRQGAAPVLGGAEEGEQRATNTALRASCASNWLLQSQA
jgi:hypothetical protein